MAKTKTGAADADATLERVSVTFDATTKQRFFANFDARRSLPSSAPLKNRQHTEQGLIAEALTFLPGLTIEAFVRQGTLAHAREIIRRGTLRGSSSRLGAADKRLSAAFAKRVAENKERARRMETPLSITASTLALDASTNAKTAERWLIRMGHEPYLPQTFRGRKRASAKD